MTTFKEAMCAAAGTHDNSIVLVALNTASLDVEAAFFSCFEVP